MQYLQQPEEGARSAGTAVIQTGVSVYWESNATHVEQQRVPLIASHLLRPPEVLIWISLLPTLGIPWLTDLVLSCLFV